MAQGTFVIFAENETWRLGTQTDAELKVVDLALPNDASPAQIALAISQALLSAGYGGQGVMLALPSSWCYSASITVGDLPRHDRKAMLYRLEEKLPLAAENVVADFCVHNAGEALGVCAKLATIVPLIDALEKEQIAVQSIVPQALLTAQGAKLEPPSSIVAFADGLEQINLIAIASGLPLNWATVPAAPADVELQLQVMTAAFPSAQALQAIKVDRDLFADTGVEVTERDDGLLTLAMSAAREILCGRARPWVELRRGPLAVGDPLRLVRRPLNWSLAAGVALLLAVAAVFMVRAHRYSQVEADARRQLVEAFQERFPGWEVPGNVRVIIESEHRKAAIAAGAVRPTQAPRSALQTMLEIMSRLPKEGRYSINQLSFAESSFELQGQARASEQLDELVAASRSAGMDVQPPEARKNAEGFWNFTLRGTLPARTESSMAKGGV